MYIFECARDPHDLIEKHGRVPDDGTRYILIVDDKDVEHRHHPNGECIPLVILYRQRAAREAQDAISRSLVAGESVTFL